MVSSSAKLSIPYHEAFLAHACRVTTATKAHETKPICGSCRNGLTVAKVQEDLGHANVSTTRLYDRRKSRPEDAAGLKISY